MTILDDIKAEFESVGGKVENDEPEETPILEQIESEFEELDSEF